MTLRVHRAPDEEPSFRPRRLRQLNLRHFFLITTVLSLAFSGFAQLGMSGAFGTLFSSWLILLGGAILWSTSSNRSTGWLLSSLAGLLITVVGIFGMYFVVTADRVPTNFDLFFESWDIITILIACLFAYAIWDICRTKWTMLIVVGPKGIRRQRGIPLHKVDMIADFLSKTELQGVVKIRALRNEKGILILRCEGALSAIEQQRLRNFLVDNL